MATEEDTNNGPAGETPVQGQQAQTQTPSGETPKVEEPKAPPVENQEPAKLPDDHPLVKALAGYKEKISKQATTLAEAQAQATKVTKLEEELSARPSQEALDTLQTRYDRLEEFLTTVGGPVGKALDSRTFTRDLFETDKDIETIVKEWHQANPSQTSDALSSAAGDPPKGKHDPNTLIRAAFNGGSK